MIIRLGKNHNPFIIYALLSLCVILSFTHCSSSQHRIAGSWQCLSHANPDPFFKKSLEEEKCQVSVIIAGDGTFTWRDGTDPVITGTWQTRGQSIIMEITGKETVPLKFHFEGEKLVLDSDDGFTFVMERKE